MAPRRAVHARGLSRRRRVLTAEALGARRVAQLPTSSAKTPRITRRAPKLGRSLGRGEGKATTRAWLAANC